MNKILYLLFIAAIFSCKSNSVAQEKDSTKSGIVVAETPNKEEPKQEKPKVQKPKFGDTQDYIDPNTVHLLGSVMDISKDTNVCGKKYKATTKIKVKAIKSSGSGIVNMISAGQEITLAFRNAAVTDFDLLKKEYGKDQEISLLVKENLCPDMSQTVYEIIRSVKE